VSATITRAELAQALERAHDEECWPCAECGLFEVRRPEGLCLTCARELAEAEWADLQNDLAKNST
jgi:hypothetical protein